MAKPRKVGYDEPIVPGKASGQRSKFLALARTAVQQNNGGPEPIPLRAIFLVEKTYWRRQEFVTSDCLDFRKLEVSRERYRILLRPDPVREQEQQGIDANG